VKIIKKVLFFVSLFAVYLILKELVVLYQFMRSIHPVAGYGALAVILVFISYFILVPLFQIVRIPRNFAPTRKMKKVPDLVERRMRYFRTNPFLLDAGFDFDNLSPDEEGYQRIVEFLKPQAEKIRKKYVTQLFYSTAIAQNGFLDAILILSSSINLVKDLFILYHGRVSNKDLLSIAKRVYYSMAIGGSEGVEYATEEIFSKLTAGGIRSIPFASKILGSIADGFVNAALLTRIAIITENYCKYIYIKSERDLYPTFNAVISSTKIITSDVIEKIFGELKHIAKDRTSRYVLMTVNPVGYIVGHAMAKKAERSDKLSPAQREMMRETAMLAQNPIGYGFGKVAGLFKNRRKLLNESFMLDDTVL